nr:response regulator 12 [Tanacetum cinerariifolium]
MIRITAEYDLMSFDLGGPSSSERLPNAALSSYAPSARPRYLLKVKVKAKGMDDMRNRETGRSSTELKMAQGEGCLLDQNKLSGGYVASNGYGYLDDLINGL